MIQSPANAGLLAPTGTLGVDAAAPGGFDIYSTVRGGLTVDVDGFAALSAGGRSGLYGIELVTGRADGLGWFPRRHAVAASPSHRAALTGRTARAGRRRPRARPG